MSVTSNGDLTLILDLRRVFIMLQIQTRFRVRRRNNLKGKNFPLKLKKQFWKKFLYFKASRRCIDGDGAMPCCISRHIRTKFLQKALKPPHWKNKTLTESPREGNAEILSDFGGIISQIRMNFYKSSSVLGNVHMEKSK